MSQSLNQSLRRGRKIEISCAIQGGGGGGPTSKKTKDILQFSRRHDLFCSLFEDILSIKSGKNNKKDQNEISCAIQGGPTTKNTKDILQISRRHDLFCSLFEDILSIKSGKNNKKDQKRTKKNRKDQKIQRT